MIMMGFWKRKLPRQKTLEKIASANIVITSDLKRSIESAKFLNPKLKANSDPLFRETELPTTSTKLWGLKLSPSIWAVILRCLWFSGTQVIANL